MDRRGFFTRLSRMWWTPGELPKSAPYRASARARLVFERGRQSGPGYLDCLPNQVILWQFDKRWIRWRRPLGEIRGYRMEGWRRRLLLDFGAPSVVIVFVDGRTRRMDPYVGFGVRKIAADLEQAGIKRI